MHFKPEEKFENNLIADSYEQGDKKITFFSGKSGSLFDFCNPSSFTLSLLVTCAITDPFSVRSPSSAADSTLLLCSPDLPGDNSVHKTDKHIH